MKKYLVVVATAFMAVISIGFWGWSNGLMMPEIVHTADDMAAAHRYFWVGQLLSVALLAGGLVVTGLAWQQNAGRLFRLATTLPLVALLVGVVISRTSLVELVMFSPIEEARFVAAANANFLEAEHLVIGVAVGGEAKAYPISMLAYHHLVNDQLAGEPFVATY